MPYNGNIMSANDRLPWCTGTVVCPFTTGRGIGTETCEMDNVIPPDDL